MSERERLLREALKRAGDLLFGTWDDDSTAAERYVKAEAIFREALAATSQRAEEGVR